MSKIGYARVSSKDQNLDRQINALELSGCERIFEEKISGASRERPELENMLSYIRHGDTLFVHSMSRLARSTRDLHNLTHELKEKGVEIVFLKEAIDTNTPAGKLMFTVLSAISEFERDILKERQAEGIEIAKAKGVYRGRPAKKLASNWEDILNKVDQKEITPSQAQDILGISKSRYYRIRKNLKFLS